MISSGSKCCRGNWAWFHCRAGQNSWSFFPRLIQTPHPPPPLFSGAIQLSLVVRSQAPWKAISGWWSCILQAIVGVPGAGSSQIWSPTKVERGVRCWSRDLRGRRGRERKREWEGCLALSYYITHWCWGWKVHERFNHIKYPTWHLSVPLFMLMFLFFSYIFISVYLFQSLARYLVQITTLSLCL